VSAMTAISARFAAVTAGFRTEIAEGVK